MKELDDADVGELWEWLNGLEKLFGKSERVARVRELVGAGLFFSRKCGLLDVGDTAILARDVGAELSKDSGWYPYREAMYKGAPVEVVSKEVLADRFLQSFEHCYGVSFVHLDEYDDNRRPEDRPVFSFRESSLHLWKKAVSP